MLKHLAHQGLQQKRKYLMTEVKRSNAQSKADTKYEEKRKGKPRLPGGYLSQEEDKLLIEMGDIYGGKQKAIFKGLELLKEQSKK